MSTFTVGLLSPGDMGHVVGQVAIANGARVITCLNGRSERTRKLAEIAGIEDVPTYSDLVREASLVICILVPAASESVAARVADALKETNEQIVYTVYLSRRVLSADRRASLEARDFTVLAQTHRSLKN